MIHFNGDLALVGGHYKIKISLTNEIDQKSVYEQDVFLTVIRQEENVQVSQKKTTIAAATDDPPDKSHTEKIEDGIG